MAMDDARIRALTDEVMASLDRDQTARTTDSLEARVAALEAVVARLASSPTAAPAPPRTARGHVALTVLDVPGGGNRCVLEPDQPCTNTGTCRSFGH
ncbi:MAG: hypothetical protein ABW221_11110 [Vicinamibacteria bacterium]